MSDLLPATPGIAAPVSGVRGELVDDQGLLARATEVAAGQRSPNTRRAYLATYRQFVAFVGDPNVGAEAFTREAMRRYRDALEACGAAPSTIARHLSALRRLADELDLDPTIGRVRVEGPPPRPPRALTAGQYEQLLCLPDRRTIRGIRDHAVLHLLGDCGLRRSELAALAYGDVVPVARHDDPRLRPAIAPQRSQQTNWDLHVRNAKRRKARSIPLSRPALDALTTWRDHRPTAATDRIFISLPSRRAPERDPAALSPAAIGEIVARYAARLVELPPHLATPHALRHTFCTLLASREVALEVIAELAGHSDVRTTRQYVDVSADRRAHAISTTFETGRAGLSRVA